MSASTYKPLPLSDVTCKTACFVSGYAPDLHMPLDDPHADSVVYLLRCAPQMLSAPFTWYVGRAKRSKLATRMKKHLAGAASDFTAENKPLFLEALYPAPLRSVEAYAYFAMMDKLSVHAITAGRLGGWTQTRPKPSQLCSLLLREQKRMVSDTCMACGSSEHFAGDIICPRRKEFPESIPIDCAHCSATIDLTSFGQTRTRPPTTRPSKASSAGSSQGSALLPTSAESMKRKRSNDDKPSATAGQLVKAGKNRKPDASPTLKEYVHVNICGKPYTNLKAFLGKDPGETQRKRVGQCCSSHAVEYQFGDWKTLTDQGFAKLQHPKDLLPERCSLSFRWTDTLCLSAGRPRKPIRARRGSSGRNVLWRVADLEAHFA